MKKIYSNIQTTIVNGEKLLAVLIDPDKFKIENVVAFFSKLNASVATHVFVGGSTVDKDVTGVLVADIKKNTKLPIVLFPGDITQITDEADALLFLSLLSGRNPEYLIEKHVKSVSRLRYSKLEIIPTGYILIESGKVTAVQKVTGTKPMDRKGISNIVDTSVAGQLLGMKLIYLEAGSGAKLPVDLDIISQVKRELNIPLIVGGGIRNIKQINDAYLAGADMVVIGTAFENNEMFFEDLNK